MAHNPILKHEKLGRLQGLKVEKDETAVLYQNQRFARERGPGERASNGEVYVVDVAAPLVQVADDRAGSGVRSRASSSKQHVAHKITVEPERIVNVVDVGQGMTL